MALCRLDTLPRRQVCELGRLAAQHAESLSHQLVRRQAARALHREDVVVAVAAQSHALGPALLRVDGGMEEAAGTCESGLHGGRYTHKHAYICIYVHPSRQISTPPCARTLCTWCSPAAAPPRRARPRCRCCCCRSCPPCPPCRLYPRCRTPGGRVEGREI